MTAYGDALNAFYVALGEMATEFGTQEFGEFNTRAFLVAMADALPELMDPMTMFAAERLMERILVIRRVRRWIES